MNLVAAQEGISMTMAIPYWRIKSLLANKRYAVESLEDNPADPATEITDEDRGELERLVKGPGIRAVGYALMPPEPAFRDVGVLYRYAIVPAMEMDRERIEMAPSPKTAKMIMEMYDALGIATNRIADSLRPRGHGAQASHPFGGLVLCPPLVQSVGLGWVGRHGLLITPQSGPRVRLAAVFTSIENLPLPERN